MDLADMIFGCFMVTGLAILAFTCVCATIICAEIDKLKKYICADWQSISHGLANPENLPEWERAMDMYREATKCQR